MTICVDQTEFVVNKLKDRGTHQAYGVVTNAQDFMHVLRFYTERWEQGDGVTAGAAGLGSAGRGRGRARFRPPRWTGSGSSAPLRRDGREWGTAVLSRVDGDRRRIYTARYMLAIKGKERGKFERAVDEVGSGPSRRSTELLQDAHRRIDDEQPPAARAARELVRRAAPDAPPR